MGTALKPLLLLDVDGPLNPYAAKPHLRPAGYGTHRIPMDNGRPIGLPTDLVTHAQRRRTLRVWLNPTHGSMLLALTDVVELHWATSWEHHANTVIAPLIGLPTLPVLTFSDFAPLDESLTVLPPYEATSSARAGGDRRAVERVHWKTRPIAGYAHRHTDRPFAWIDDEITDADRHFLASGSPPQHLLHRIDPRIGLTAGDLTRIRDWAAAL